ncbi:MAG: Biosynthetic arginine decarboxylase, partial [Verrucomicrobiota bacterium]
MQQQQPWDIPAAISLYNIDRWGGGYFGVNESGNVQIFPTQDTSTPIDIMDLVAEAKAHGLSFPMVLRFQDLLRHRVQTINKAFASAIEEFKYGNVYRGVFPIKVNQLQEVVEEIMSAGEAFHFGIEAGSKPELLAAMAIHRDPESLIICNGYKDVQFIQNALLGTRLGKRVILVVEKLEELQQILTVAREVGVEPWVGVRVRLMAKGAGKWALSGGENAKFGLSTADLVAASDM